MDSATDRPSPSGSVPKHVAIEGPIGVGKTTLARLLAARLEARAVLEEVDDNEFLSRFYEDRQRFAFQTQVAFLLSRYRQQRRILARPDERVVSDYVMDKDRIFAGINLSGPELLLYEQLWRLLGPLVPPPDVLVLLLAPVEVLMHRIARRGRRYESMFDRNYLGEVAERYTQYFTPETFRDRRGSSPRGSWGGCPLLVVDTTELDLVANEADQANLLAAIVAHRRGVRYHESLGSRGR